MPAQNGSSYEPVVMDQHLGKHGESILPKLLQSRGRHRMETPVSRWRDMQDTHALRCGLAGFFHLEGQHLLAILSEKSKEYDAAEQHLRQAIQLAPKQAGRVMELARFLAQRGRAKESDALFDQAEHMAPENHSILFYRAQTYIETNRNLGEARVLLQNYLRATLGPDDPPRQRAQELLAKTH